MSYVIHRLAFLFLVFPWVALADSGTCQSTFELRNVLIFTDASYSQKSGVVSVMKNYIAEGPTAAGLNIQFITPEDFKLHTKPVPFWQNFVGSYAQDREIESILQSSNPAAIHLMTEGPVGLRLAAYLTKHGIPYNTAYHTDWVKYPWVWKTLAGLNDGISEAVRKRIVQFHSRTSRVLVPTEDLKEVLAVYGVPWDSIVVVPHGVNADLFSPQGRGATFEDRAKIFAQYAKGLKKPITYPISFYGGRIAPEKNLEDFMRMKVPGTKILVGPGDPKQFQELDPDAIFLGPMPYEQMNLFYKNADLFVFTSDTDTYGLVLLESLATGTPVLAFDIQGPKDVITSDEVGIKVPYVKDDHEGNVRRLEQNFNTALNLSRDKCRAYAEGLTWTKAIQKFVQTLIWIDPKAEPEFLKDPATP